MTCDLCEEKSMSYRNCIFGKKSKNLCTKCLGQFKVACIDKLYVELQSRQE